MVQILTRKQGFILNFLLIILLLTILGILSYYLYMNIPGAGQVLSLKIQANQEFEITKLSGNVSQFYPNMKFNHNSISYKIDERCNNEKKQRMTEAFNELEEEIEIINFYPVSENHDIEVSCTENFNDAIKKDFFIAGEGGAREIIQTGRYNIILNGIILLFANPQKAVRCDWPNIEIHELIHVFGFDHSKNKESLMYPYLETCGQKLDNSVINKLKGLYSEENLPDLYFSNLSVIKKGRYLDFNMTIQNSGSIDAKNAKLAIIDDGEIAETLNLTDLKFGAGIFMEIKNLKLIHRNPNEIKFLIDPSNSIKEINEENNIALVDFGLK